MAKSRSIKDYMKKTKEDLIKILNKPKSKIKEIKKDFSELGHGIFKPKINEFKRSLYNIKNQKNLDAPEIKETEKSLYNLKKYHDYYEDYYKPTKTKGVFNGNYIEYESKGDKDKNLSPKEYLNIIRPYLSDMINDHKKRREWKIQLTMQINFISFKDPRAVIYKL